MGLRQQSAIAVIWSGVQTWTNRLVGFVVLIVLARLLTPVDFGIVAAAAVILAIVQLLFEQAFEEALVQRQSIERGHLDTTFWLLVALGGLGTLLLLVIAPHTARWLQISELSQVMIVMAPTVFISALSKVQVALLRRQFRFKALAVRQLLSSIGAGCVAIGMGLAGLGVWSLVGRQVTESVLGLILLWSMAPWRPGLAVSRRYFDDVFGFGSKILLANWINAISTRLDGLLIGYVLGAPALGMYTIGQRLFHIAMEMLYGVINPVAMSTFSRLQGDQRRLRGAFLETVRLTGFVALPLFFALAAFGGQIVPMLFGEQWRNAGPVLQVFAVGGVLFSVGFFNHVLMKSLGKAGWVVRLVALSAVLNLAGFVTAVQFGFVAVAAAFVVRGYLVFPLTLRLTQRLLQLRLRSYWQQLYPSLFASIGATIVAVVSNELLPMRAEPWRIMLALMVGGITYLSILQGLWGAFVASVLSAVRMSLHRS